MFPMNLLVQNYGVAFESSFNNSSNVGILIQLFSHKNEDIKTLKFKTSVSLYVKLKTI